MNFIDRIVVEKHFFCKKSLNPLRAFIICLVVLTTQSTLGLRAQEGRVTIKAQKSSIKEILKEIESKSEYTFFYNDADMDFGQKVDVKANNEEIKTVLGRILPTFAFKQDHKKVMLVPSKSVQEGEQTKLTNTKSVKGVVLDEFGEPLVGVSIKMQGSNTVGTISDMDGAFELHVLDNANLELSYVGYLDQVVSVKGRSELNLVLTENTSVLDEIVVVGYGVQKKANLSGAVESVSRSVLKDRPVTNVGQALQGAVGNLNITLPSGQANSEPKFNVRGITALKSDNEVSPLVVIDGITATIAELNTMNPNDIENMTVLKDAASAAIYGSRAAFGVILVTTKKGEGEKIKVNYNNNFSFKKLTNKPDIITDPATVVDMKNIFSYPWYNLYDAEAIAYAQKRSQDPSGVPPYYVDANGKWAYFGDTNWFDEAYKGSSFSTTHGIDVSGSTKKASYFFSGNYQRDEGMLKQDNDIYNRYNLRSKLDFKITDWWSVGNNTSYSTAHYDSPTYLGWDYYWAVSRMNPLAIPNNPDGTWTESGADLLGKMREGGRQKTLKSTLTSHFNTKIDLIKNMWSIDGSFSLARTEYSLENAKIPVGHKLGPDRQMTYTDGTSSAKEESAHTDHIVFDVFTSFNKTFEEKHFVNVVGGFNQEEDKYRKFEGEVKELISENLPSVNQGVGDQTVKGARSQYALRGLFYRFNYIFDNKYIIETNGRYDGTSRFSKDDRFVFNPSVSAAWIASQESFMKFMSPIVNHLKFRVSYGNLGNQVTADNYPYIQWMEKKKSSLLLDGKQMWYVKDPKLVSGNLTWETVSTLNFGTDINFLDNRLTTAFDIYQRDIKDMLSPGKELPAVLGADEPNENSVDIRTKGWELTLRWRDQFNLQGKPFAYNFSFVLSDNETTVTKFDNPTGSLKELYKGKKFGEIWGLETLGYFTSSEDVKNHANQTNVSAYPGTHTLEAGDLKFKDQNNDDIIDKGDWTLGNPGDYRVIGNTSPRYTFSFGAGAEWSNFDFNIYLQGVGKRDYAPGGSDLLFWGVNSQPWTNINKQNLDYWTPEHPNAYFPRRKGYVAEGDKELGTAQTKYLQNAAYMRLKNLTVGYTLPQSITRKANISRLRLFFSGENLAEISGLDSHYKADPEGLNGQMYPFQRSFSFGLNVSF